MSTRRRFSVHRLFSGVLGRKEREREKVRVERYRHTDRQTDIVTERMTEERGTEN